MTRKKTSPLASLDHIAPALRPLALPVSDLVSDPENVRRHNPKNLRAISASLSRFGQRVPLVVRRETMTVEKGNGTLEAARALGWTQIAVVLVDDDHKTANGFALADNRTAELADWDVDRLVAQFSLHEDLSGLGFDAEDVHKICASQRVAYSGVEEMLKGAFQDARGSRHPSEAKAFTLTIPADFHARLKKVEKERGKDWIVSRLIEVVDEALSETL